MWIIDNDDPAIDIQGHLLRWYLNPQHVPKTPYLRSYDWMSSGFYHLPNHPKMAKLHLGPQPQIAKALDGSEFLGRNIKAIFAAKNRWFLRSTSRIGNCFGNTKDHE